VLGGLLTVLGWMCSIGGAVLLALMALGWWLDADSKATQRPERVAPSVPVRIMRESASDDYELTVERLRILEEDAARRLRNLRGYRR
jgi:hypothetical protein